MLNIPYERIENLNKLFNELKGLGLNCRKLESPNTIKAKELDIAVRV